jgi:hypothetical protein
LIKWQIGPIHGSWYSILKSIKRIKKENGKGKRKRIGG